MLADYFLVLKSLEGLPGVRLFKSSITVYVSASLETRDGVPLSSLGTFSTKQYNGLKVQFSESFTFRDVSTHVCCRLKVYSVNYVARNLLLGEVLLPVNVDHDFQEEFEVVVPPTQDSQAQGMQFDSEMIIKGTAALRIRDEAGDMVDKKIQEYERLAAQGEGVQNEFAIFLVRLAGVPRSQEDSIKVRVTVGNDERDTRLLRGEDPLMIGEEVVIQEVTDDEELMKLEILSMSSTSRKEKLLSMVSSKIGALRGDDGVKRLELILRSPDGETDGNSYGVIEVLLQWRFNPVFAPRISKRSSFINWMAASFGAAPEEEDEGYDFEKLKDESGKKKKEKEGMSIEEAEEEKRRVLSEKSKIELKEGKYQLHVHVIEARDLKGEDFEKTSDPVVIIEAWDEKRVTTIKRQCLNAIWDENFVFSLELSASELRAGLVQFKVYDANTYRKNELIGCCGLDAMEVYYANEAHEIYRKWLGLVDDEQVEDVGIQGYLKVSVALMGPGDKIRMHDEVEDRRKEKLLEAEAGGVDATVIMPVSIKLKTMFLVTTVYRGEYFPQMDVGTSVLHRGGIDAYAQLDVGGRRPVRTKVLKVRGKREDLNPLFRTEMWVPVTLPTLSGLCSLSFWDYESVRVNNELMSTTYFHLKDVKERPAVKWINLYGAPIHLTDNIVTPLPGMPLDGVTLLNKFPEMASTYRGRALVMHRLVDVKDRPEKKPIDGFIRRVRAIPAKYEPREVAYMLKLLVVQGHELPLQREMKSLSTTLSRLKYYLRISMGGFEKFTSAVDSNSGMCEWNAMFREIVRFPEDIHQVPDLIIHLCRSSDNVPLCFTRLPAKDILGFDGEPKWVFFEEDKALDCLYHNVFPGMIQLKVGFGSPEEGVAADEGWRKEVEGMQSRKLYTVRVNIFQGRDLPSADSSGLIDPYLSVNFAGKLEKSSVKRATRNPLFYEAVTFQACTLTSDLRYAPLVSVQLFDEDQYDADDYLGSFFVDIAKEMRSSDDDPEWRDIYPDPAKTEKKEGQILCSVELFEIDEETEEVPVKELEPGTVPAAVEMIILGFRDMKACKGMPLQLPYAELTVNSPSGRIAHRTKASKKPSGPNANILEKVKLEVDLPQKALFAPPLTIKVYDTRLGGFLTPFVGSASVSLHNRIPWDPVTKGDPVEEMDAISEAVEQQQQQQHQDEGDEESTLLQDLEDEHGLPRYMVGRDIIGKSWEEEFGEGPFETITLSRGTKLPSFLGGGSTYHTVGFVKGIIRVRSLEEADARAGPMPVDIRELSKPSAYVDLAPREWGKSDPYVRVRLGDKVVFNDRENYVDDVTELDVYTGIEVSALLPGEGRISVDVMDYDMIGGDDVIGTTVIDLEDRWFDPTWRRHGIENRVEVAPSFRYETKPVETRQLMVPTSLAPQGALEMWLDILLPGEAGAFAMDAISLPPSADFEVRVVIWKCKEVISGDRFEDLNDMYVKAWVEGCDPQETDTHWRSKHGKANFNYRLKFDVQLGRNTRAMKFPYFTIQIWDRDVLKWNDCLAEAMLDFGKAFRVAYHKRKAIKMFKKKKAAPKEGTQERNNQTTDLQVILDDDANQAG